MIDAFVRIGPLMDPASYPQWAQQLIEECRESKRRVVEHELYERLRDGRLKPSTIRQYLIGGWPVVEQFSLYMAHNLTKTSYGRHPGEDMARRWLMRNIRVELNHADYWVHWCHAHGVHLHDLQAQRLQFGCMAVVQGDGGGFDLYAQARMVHHQLSRTACHVLQVWRRQADGRAARNAPLRPMFGGRR